MTSKRIFAIRDGETRWCGIAIDFPGVQMQRVPWYENQSCVVAAGGSLGVLSLVFLALPGAPGGAFVCASARVSRRSRARSGLLGTAPGGVHVGPVSGDRGDLFHVKGDDLMPPTPEWFKWFVAANWVTAWPSAQLFAVISGIRVGGAKCAGSRR